MKNTTEGIASFQGVTQKIISSRQAKNMRILSAKKIPFKFTLVRFTPVPLKLCLVKNE